MLTVAIPTGGTEDAAWHRRWLETKLGPVVARCAGRVRPGLRVAFVVQPAMAPLDPAL